MPFLREPRRRWWLGFASLCLSALIHVAIYLPDHRSTSFLVLAVIVSVGALVGITLAGIVALRLNPLGISRLRERARRWQSAYLAFSLALVFAYGLGMRPEWMYTHIGLMLGAGLTLGYELLYSTDPSLTRRGMLLIGAAVIAVTLLRVLALTVYPAYNNNDEPWVLNWALTYTREGRFADTLLYYGGGDVQRFMLPVGLWLRLVGEGFWQARLFFFLMIFPLTAFTALAAHRLYRSGWIAALFMFSSAVVMGGARIRQDIGLALAVAAALWLYSEAARRSRNSLHFGAGVALGLGWFAHYHAIGFGAALLVALYLPRWAAGWRRGKRLPETGAFLFAAGGLLAAGSVFLLQILPDWEGFLALRQFRNPPTLTDLVNVFFQHWSNIALYSQLELVLVLVALAAAVWRRRIVDVQMALLLVLLHAALALQAGEPYSHYVLQISPIYGVLVAALFAYGGGRQRIAYAGAAAALFLLPNLGFTLQTPLQHAIRREPLELPAPPVVQWVRENVAPEQKIVTEHWYYLWLTDYPFISPLSAQYVPAAQRLDSREAQWDQIAPDVVVLDRNLATCCVQQPIYDAAYLASRGYEVVAEIPGERYPVLVYKKGAENAQH